ncbi:MAG: PorT family protein [Dysgonamonadaceae bacterium]|jgi:hypothetical protein|nr:PorT family protein [Dysgonamonadaceae bacterium]
MKRIFLGLILLFTIFVSYSQKDEFQPEWAFGANSGLTFSKMRFYPRIPQDLLRQVEGGITVRYISEKHFGIQCELNYSLRGWTERTDTIAHFNKYARSLAYLELPLMTHLYFDLGKKARLVFNAGPQVGCHLNEKILKKEINTVSDEYSGYYDQNVQQKFDYGIGGGMGFEIRTNIGSFILEGRYYFGLSDIFSSSKADYFQASSPQIIEIKLTYLYH